MPGDLLLGLGPGFWSDSATQDYLEVRFLGEFCVGAVVGLGSMQGNHVPILAH